MICDCPNSDNFLQPNTDRALSNLSRTFKAKIKDLGNKCDKCDECGKSFGQKATYQRHMATVHA